VYPTSDLDRSSALRGEEDRSKESPSSISLGAVANPSSKSELAEARNGTRDLSGAVLDLSSIDVACVDW
jgi:hypothetical protein